MKVKEAIRIAVEEEGWTYVRTRGNHRIFRKKGCSCLVIPGKLSADIPKGTEKSILRQIRGA